MRDAISGIEAGAATHIGKVRQHNEDNYLVATHRGLWAVADGMGGHEAGDVASQVVMEELDAIVTPSTAAELLASCEASMVVANSRLKEMSDERGALVGTTVAVLLVFDTFYAGVWSGDSRIYRIRGQGIEQITLDHSETPGARIRRQTQCRGSAHMATKECHNPGHRRSRRPRA